MENREQEQIRPQLQQTPPLQGRTTFLQILFLQAAMVLFSGVSVLSKLAGRFPLISFPCLALLAGGICLLGVYALVWQQVLKRVPLTTAYANRGTVMIYSVIFGVLLFGEKLTWNMVAGAIVIVFGVYLVVTADA